MADLLSKQIPHLYSGDESNIRSIHIASFNEGGKKYADCVVVKDTFQDWVHEIHTNASGVVEIDKSPRPPDGPPVHAHPNQPDPADPLCGVKVPCIGDQLTGVRFARAKNLRAGAHTCKGRLDHLYPFCCVASHTKRSLALFIVEHRFLHSLSLGKRISQEEVERNNYSNIIRGFKMF